MTFDPLAWLDDELTTLDAQHLQRHLTVRTGPQQATVEFDGRTYINFGANDYLGLAADPRLATAAARAITTDGWGAGASPLVTGHSAAHVELEKKLAEFEAAEKTGSAAIQVEGKLIDYAMYQRAKRVLELAKLDR